MRRSAAIGALLLCAIPAHAFQNNDLVGLSKYDLMSCAGDPQGARSHGRVEYFTYATPHARGGAAPIVQSTQPGTVAEGSCQISFGIRHGRIISSSAHV